MNYLYIKTNGKTDEIKKQIEKEIRSQTINVEVERFVSKNNTITIATKTKEESLKLKSKMLGKIKDISLSLIHI